MKIDINNPSGISLILFGAIITFISTYIIEYIKNKREKAEKTKNFKLFIKLELAVVAKTLDKLQTALSYGNYYDYSLLDRAKESIDNLEKARTDVIYLSEPELKEKFIDLISDTSTYVATVRVVQQLFYSDRDKILGQKPKKKDRPTGAGKVRKQTPIAADMPQVIDQFSKRTTEKAIEYIEIKRRLEDLIKSLE
jgi:hypothetical protein